MVSFTGNTGVYLQYAHTRIRSILRNAGDPDVTINPDVPLEPAERALALELDTYADTLAEVSANLEPHRLAGYLYDLARDFTTFYEACPVLKAEEPVRGNRLALCRLAARTLKHGLGLLGIAAPERMYHPAGVPRAASTAAFSGRLTGMVADMETIEELAGA